MFAIKVPPSFGTSKLTWTLKVNGQEAKVTFWLNPPYWVDFFKNAASGNEPPVVRFAPDGPALTGPPLGFAQTLTAAVGQPVALRLWASDLAGPREGPDAELAEIRRRTNPVVDPVAIVGDNVFGGAAKRSDPAARADVLVHWHKYRGPGPVAFAAARVPVVTKGDPAAVVEAVDHRHLHRAGRVRAAGADLRRVGRERRRRPVLLDHRARQGHGEVTRP